MCYRAISFEKKTRTVLRVFCGFNYSTQSRDEKSKVGQFKSKFIHKIVPAFKLTTIPSQKHKKITFKNDVTIMHNKI